MEIETNTTIHRINMKYLWILLPFFLSCTEQECSELKRVEIDTLTIDTIIYIQNDFAGWDEIKKQK